MTASATTFGSLVEETTRRLRIAGVEAPRHAALRLVGDLAGTTGGTALLEAHRPAPRELHARVLAAADRRAHGEPIAYVTGRAGFRYLDLMVDRRVLIPRPETEQLVELVLHAAGGGRVVDVGTGSGCIALSLAREGQYREIVGIDQSSGALEVARRNAASLGLTVRWLEGNLLAPVQGTVFDAVVSNPPYLSAAEYRVLDPSVRGWEPSEALVSGEDGLDFIRRLLADAPAVLAPGGFLALEIDSSRAAATAALARSGGWQDVAVIADLFGRDRFLTARRGSTR